MEEGCTRRRQASTWEPAHSLSSVKEPLTGPDSASSSGVLFLVTSHCHTFFSLLLSLRKVTSVLTSPQMSLRKVTSVLTSPQRTLLCHISVPSLLQLNLLGKEDSCKVLCSPINKLFPRGTWRRNWGEILWVSPGKSVSPWA